MSANSTLQISHCIDIVLVNWNSGNWLSNCIHCIYASEQQELISKIIIVDNNSVDDSLKRIAPNSVLHIIRNNTNRGFAAACNQGLEVGRSKYVLFLNTDVEIKSTTLLQCVDFMERNDWVDISGVMQLNSSGKIQPSCARFPTPTRFFFDSAGLSKVFPSMFKPATLMKDWDHQQSKKVDQIMGSFMFTKRSLFGRIGNFDERFFVYFEELDLSKRLSNAGGISFYNHQISIMHAGGGTTDKVKAFRLFLSWKSKLIYSQKHFTTLGYISTCLATYFIEIIVRTTVALFTFNLTTMKEIFHAYTMLLKNRGYGSNENGTFFRKG